MGTPFVAPKSQLHALPMSQNPPTKQCGFVQVHPGDTSPSLSTDSVLGNKRDWYLCQSRRNGLFSFWCSVSTGKHADIGSIHLQERRLEAWLKW